MQHKKERPSTHKYLYLPMSEIPKYITDLEDRIRTLEGRSRALLQMAKKYRDDPLLKEVSAIDWDGYMGSRESMLKEVAGRV